MSTREAGSSIENKPKHHTFRNFMWLILVVLLLWCWFNYLPQQAVSTLTAIKTAVVGQYDSWNGNDLTTLPQEIINKPIIITGVGSGSLESEGELLSGDETMSGGLISGQIILGSGDQIIGDMNDQTTGSVDTGSTIWDEVDTMLNPEATDTPVATTGSTTGGERIIQLNDLPTASSPGVISIMIGGQTIMVDGTPDEDIIINANGYRVIVQRN